MLYLLRRFFAKFVLRIYITLWCRSLTAGASKYFVHLFWSLPRVNLWTDINVSEKHCACVLTAIVLISLNRNYIAYELYLAEQQPCLSLYVGTNVAH
jgi:hypothetical protein